MQGLSINIEMLREVANFVGNEANNYDSNLTELYNKFNALSNFWSGPDYDAASAVMTQNKQPLLDLGITLHEISTALNNISDDYQAKINKSAAQYEMEER